VKNITLATSNGRASLMDLDNLLDIMQPINSRRGIDSVLTGATLDLAANKNVSNPCLVGHLRYAIHAYASEDPSENIMKEGGPVGSSGTTHLSNSNLATSALSSSELTSSSRKLFGIKSFHPKFSKHVFRRTSLTLSRMGLP